MDFGALYLELRTWLSLHPDAILFSVFLLATIEAIPVIGFVIPAIPMLFVLSVLAAHAGAPLLALFVAGIAGAMLGDGVSYLLGHRYKHRIETVWPFSRYPDWLRSAEAFVEKHGGKSIIFGRFIGPLRSFVPLAAGIFRMKPIYFLLMNLLSAIAWAPFHLLPGYSLGAASAHDLPGRAQLLLVAALLVMVAVLTWLLPAHQTWRQRRNLTHPLANTGRYWAHDEHPENQRAALRIALFAFAGFAAITCLLPWLKPWDMSATVKLFTLRQASLDPLFIVFSLFADRHSLHLLGGVLLLWLAARREWGSVKVLLMITALSLGLPALLKLFMALPRPLLVMTPPSSPAFPSGHAFSAVLVWGFLLIFLNRFKSDNAMGIFRPTLLAMMLFTIASRPYLGVHWVSDVLAGGLLGLACLGAVRWYWYRQAAPKVSLTEALTVCALALCLSIGLEVWPHYTESLVRYQPLPGLLPSYLLLP